MLARKYLLRSTLQLSLLMLAAQMSSAQSPSNYHALDGVQLQSYFSILNNGGLDVNGYPKETFSAAYPGQAEELRTEPTEVNQSKVPKSFLDYKREKAEKADRLARFEEYSAYTKLAEAMLNNSDWKGLERLVLTEEANSMGEGNKKTTGLDVSRVLFSPEINSRITLSAGLLEVQLLALTKLPDASNQLLSENNTPEVSRTVERRLNLAVKAMSYLEQTKASNPLASQLQQTIAAKICSNFNRYSLVQIKSVVLRMMVEYSANNAILEQIAFHLNDIWKFGSEAEFLDSKKFQKTVTASLIQNPNVKAETIGHIKFYYPKDFAEVKARQSNVDRIGKNCQAVLSKI